MTKKEIIETIKQQRINLDVSQDILANRSGTYKGDISNIEASKKDITLSKLISITNALNLQVVIIPK